jgi:hypothetical protein
MNFKYLTIYKFKKIIKKTNIYENLDYDYLSFNQNAINYLSKNKDKINWSNISLNPKAIPILDLNKDKINWNNVALNRNAYKFILNNINYIDKRFLYYNKNLLIKKINNVLPYKFNNRERKIVINESSKLFYFTTNIILQKTLFINFYYNSENKKWNYICENPFLFYKFKFTII